MAGLKQSQKQTAGQQSGVGLNKSRCKSHGRPEQQNDRIQPSDTCSVRNDSENDRSGREREAEREFEIAILLL